MLECVWVFLKDLVGRKFGWNELVKGYICGLYVDWK